MHTKKGILFPPERNHAKGRVYPQSALASKPEATRSQILRKSKLEKPRGKGGVNHGSHAAGGGR